MAINDISLDRFREPAFCYSISTHIDEFLKNGGDFMDVGQFEEVNNFYDLLSS